MRITAPVSRLEEIEALAHAGAEEVYCGVVPAEWVERFGTSAVNRRIFGNLGSYDALRAAVDAAHRCGIGLFLVMNAQHYAAGQLDALLDLARHFDDMGGDAVIVADIGLLQLLGASGFRFRLHVSSVLGCRNAGAARLYRDMGAARVILPRDVTIDEIRALVTEVPRLEIEAFILNDGCVFEEGSCHTIHLPARLGGPICLDHYDNHWRRLDGKPLEAEALARNDEQYQRWLWYRMGCGFSLSESGYPFGPCGLCAIPAFRAAGLTSVKIAGREGASARKLKSVELVKAVLDRAATSEAARALAIERRGKPEYCDAGQLCYYRNTLPSTCGQSREKGPTCN